MNLARYNALTGDTKLAAALAIACGWNPSNVNFVKSWCGNYLEATQMFEGAKYWHKNFLMGEIK